ncbi:hypothetical protein [Alkalihalobacterium elongatum]|uniref:hypothetical protein n=1 Tax=Alkalihalobacterium elongatum TaxID=2675466 RepID=UPI001C1FCFCF|nr:hypothetical protein [Alkalihalobacterium elongatum]
MVKLTCNRLYGLMIVLLLVCCSNEKIEAITVFKMDNFTEIVEDSSVIITATNEIEIIQKAFIQAVKQPGVVDMADPQYKLEWNEESYFLWINESSGTIMNTTETHTNYSLSERSAHEVYQLIENSGI